MTESIQMALIGGALIGLAASAMLLLVGRITGISGIAGGLLRLPAGDTAWRVAFIAGLLAGAAVLMASMPEAFQAPSGRSLGAIGVAGLLVGFGTRLGNGCTSGHGVCGLSRMSIRSAAATATFMATGMATATAIHLFTGGAL